MKTNILLEKYLVDWAYWTSRIEQGIEGHPKRSLVSVMMEVGIFARGYSGSTIPYQSGREEKLNCLINQMGVEQPQFKEAIKAYYLRRNITLPMVARELNISLATLKERVNKAKQYLSRFYPEEKHHIGVKQNNLLSKSAFFS